MLLRQRLVLGLLAAAGRPVEKRVLMKWAFLLRNEYPQTATKSFYDFFPGEKGPFSFGLDREIGTLIETGLITEDVSSGTWKSTSTGQEFKHDSSIRRIIDRFAPHPMSRLVDYVSKSYPEFASAKGDAQGKAAEIQIYTAGYEGLQIDGFLNLLIRSGIARLIDVRNNPIARRFGFHKSTLNRLCNQIGIRYIHVPELGIPSAMRQSLDSPDSYRALFVMYENETLKNNRDKVHEITTLIEEMPSVLVCMEAHHCNCHRSRLAEAIHRQTNLPITHLAAQPLP